MNLIVEGLPKRQGEVVRLAALGMGEKETARAMNCGVYNVQSLRSSAFYKLRAQNITHAVAQAFKLGHLKYVPVFLLCLLSAISGVDERLRVRSGRSTRIVTIREVS